MDKGVEVVIEELTMLLARAFTRSTERIIRASVLALLSGLVKRRAYVRVGNITVFPNLWVFYLARSGLFAKTTLLNAIRDLAEAVDERLPLPDLTTPEGLLAALGENAKRLLLANEASQVFAMASREHQRGWLETLLRLHDSERRIDYAPKTKELQTKVRDVYVAAVMCSTPSAMARFVADEALWRHGLWGRFAWVFEDNPPPYARSEEIAHEEWEEAIGWLRAFDVALQNLCAHHATPSYRVRLTPEAEALFWDFDETTYHDLAARPESVLDSAEARVPTLVLKVATLLSLADWARRESPDPPPVIDAQLWKKALGVVDEWHASLRELVARAESLKRANGDAALRERIIAALAEAPNGEMRRRDLARKLGVYGQALDLVLADLARDEIVVLGERDIGGSTSRLVRLARDWGSV